MRFHHILLYIWWFSEPWSLPPGMQFCQVNGNLIWKHVQLEWHGMSISGSTTHLPSPRTLTWTEIGYHGIMWKTFGGGRFSFIPNSHPSCGPNSDPSSAGHAHLARSWLWCDTARLMGFRNRTTSLACGKWAPWTLPILRQAANCLTNQKGWFDEQEWRFCLEKVHFYLPRLKSCPQIAKQIYGDQTMLRDVTSINIGIEKTEWFLVTKNRLPEVGRHIRLRWSVNSCSKSPRLGMAIINLLSPFIAVP